MRFSNALIVSASLGKFASDAYVIRPHRNHKSYNLLVKKPSSLYGTAGDWDNDDFLDSLGKAAKDEPEEPKEPKEQQPSRFVQLNAIKEQGNAAGNKPPNALGAPPSFTDLADSLINSPSQQPNPQFQPAGYPPPPPVDPNNPYAAYPPPPPVDPNNPYAVYPPPPPPNPQDPNAPPPSYPAYPYPYPPPPYPPPPEGADPNDPSQPPPVYNPYAAYGYPPPPPQQQAPPPPPKPQSRVMDGQRVGRNRDADAIANTADLYFAQLKLDSKIRKKAFLAGDVETSNKPFDDERVRILKETLQDNPHIMAERKRAHEEEQSFLESPAGQELFQAIKTDSSFERKVTNSDYSGQSYKAKLLARTGRKLRSTSIPKPEPEPDSEPEPPVAEVQAPPAPEPVAPPPPLQTQPAAPVFAAESSKPAALDINYVDQADESQHKIRSLMELLLKYREEPNLGAGQLTPVEEKRLEDSVKEVTEMLKSESGLGAISTKDEIPTIPAPEPEPVVPPPVVEEAPVASADTGMSYKEKLLAKKTTEMQLQETRVAPPPTPPVMESSPAESAATGMSYKEKLLAKKGMTMLPQETQTPPPPQPVAPVAAVESSPSTALDINDDYAEESRRKIRTLMGLLLKHRGGPGFGAGRLQPVEGKRLEDTVKEVSDMLKSECGFSIEDAIISTKEETPPVAVVDTPATPTPPVESNSSIQNTILCVEGALAAYKSSSPTMGSQSEALDPLRAAFMAAVNTMNQVIAEEEVVIAGAADESVMDKQDIVSDDEKLRKTFANLLEVSGNEEYGLD